MHYQERKAVKAITFRGYSDRRSIRKELKITIINILKNLTDRHVWADEEFQQRNIYYKKEIIGSDRNIKLYKMKNIFLFILIHKVEKRISYLEYKSTEIIQTGI